MWFVWLTYLVTTAFMILMAIAAIHEVDSLLDKSLIGIGAIILNLWVLSVAIDVANNYNGHKKG